MEYNQSSVMFRGYEDLDDKADVGMDIDVDEEDLHAYTQPNQHANNSWCSSTYSFVTTFDKVLIFA